MGKVNWKLMINHASAFIVYLIGFIVAEIIISLTGGPDSPYYDTLLMVITVLGTTSMMCLSVLLWHLGTKVDENTLSSFIASFK